MSVNLVLKPTVLALLGLLIVQYSGLDQSLSSLIYFPAEQWQFKQSWLFGTVLHQGGRMLIGVLLVTMLLAGLLSLLPHYRSHPYTPIVRYVLLATLLSILSVSALKQVTTLPCPWDISLFGGERSNVLFARAFSTKLDVGHCFPSGHASGGFALFSFYFAALGINRINRNRPNRLRDRLWLLPGMLTGILFGVAQQLRGAHFLSHDMASAAVCWLVCGSLAYLMLPKAKNSTSQNVIRVPTISAE